MIQIELKFNLNYNKNIIYKFVKNYYYYYYSPHNVVTIVNHIRLLYFS
jgi:hypothetical protein